MIKTKVIKIDPQNIDLAKIKKAALVIKKGGIVAFPTETVYGLAADFSNKRAVNRIFRLKKRPQGKPLTVQIPDITYLEELAYDIPAFAYQLMSRFWPGPLTLVFKANSGVPAHLISGKTKKTVGVRIPDNTIARALIKESAVAIVAPSANLWQKPAALTAKEVLQTFKGRIAMVIDGGRSKLGVASTVVDLSVSPYKILRKGAISQKDIQIVQG